MPDQTDLPGSDPAARDRARAAWREALAATGGDARRGGATLAALVRRYRGRHRAYHTEGHVAALVALADRDRGLLASWAAVVLAIWYHDAVYRLRRSDNEAESAALGGRELLALGVSEPIRGAVTGLILATARHRPPPGLADGPWFLDADLSILGSPAPVYAAYRNAIRREYRWIPAPLYRRRRVAVLAGFLARERIYLTDGYRLALEPTARVNLAAEIRALSGGSVEPDR